MKNFARQLFVLVVIILAAVSCARVTAPPSATTCTHSANNYLVGPAFAPPIAENGSFYGELNQYGVPKTVFVHGYFRSDGTYVRSYYRSRPSR